MLSGKVSDLGRKGAGASGTLDVAHVFMHFCSVGVFLGGREAFAAIVFEVWGVKGVGIAVILYAPDSIEHVSTTYINWDLHHIHQDGLS